MSDARRQWQFALVFLVLLVSAAGNTAMQSVLPVIGRATRIPDLAIAIIFSLSALFWTFSAPYWARQSDRKGRRQLMEVGLLGFALSMLLSGLVVMAGVSGLTIPLATFVLFTLARSLFGLFGSASNPAAQAFVAARTSATERTGALTLLASAFGLGTIVGPAVAPFFILPYVGLAGPLLIFAVIAALTMVAVRFGLPDDGQTTGQTGGAVASMPSVGGSATGATIQAASEMQRSGVRQTLSWRDRRVKPFMIYGFAVGSVQAALTQAIGFFIIDRMANAGGLSAPQMIGMVLMAGAGATLLVQWGVIRILGLSPSQLMRWGVVIAALGSAGIALSDSVYSLLLAFSVTSAGFGFCRPGFTAGSSLAVSRDEQGAVAGAVTAVNGACYIAAPAIGIGLLEFSLVLPYWLGAAALALLAVYAWRHNVLRSAGRIAAGAE